MTTSNSEFSSIYRVTVIYHGGVYRKLRVRRCTLNADLWLTISSTCRLFARRHFPDPVYHSHPFRSPRMISINSYLVLIYILFN